MSTVDDTLTLPASQWGAEFTAADEALANFEWMTASVTLAGLPEGELEGDDNAYLQYLQARISHIRGQHAQARSQLEAISRSGLHPAIAYRIHNFQRALLDQEQDHLGSARMGVSIMKIAPSADQPGLKRSVWRDLERLDRETLQQAIPVATDPDWRAWLELASISRGDLGQQSIQLPGWVAANPGHPANAPLPGGLEYLLAAARPPAKVALLLPLSGRLAPAGKAVRDGFLASYYQARSAGPAPGEVVVLDSDQYSSALEAYNDAALQGVELLVGPLSKTKVRELATHPSRTIPVLALNQIDQAVNPAGSALVQLSLAPEDEAARIAELAFGQGARRAILLRPVGSWGDKMERALAARWRQLGGEVASSVSYTGRDDYSASIKSGLGLEQSETRKRRLRDMLATNVEFTPRRRQDLDVVFMLSRNGPEARSLKPLLAFHYAGQLPVYAPSSVYTGTPDSRDVDLNGINLVDLPWLLGSNPSLKAELAAASSDHYTRLNALGVDAYRLQARFRQLQGGPDALIRGDTGLLSMNSRLQMARELPPATFDGGAIKPL
jgi:outer membrane PBP1 activator LpoA protein